MAAPGCVPAELRRLAIGRLTHFSGRNRSKFPLVGVMRKSVGDAPMAESDP